MSGASRIDRLAVLGAGLIGASFAAALRRAGFAARAIGWDRDPGHLDEALALGHLDEVAGSAALAVAGADLVVLAMPVAAIGAAFGELAPALAPGAVLTDVGSTKQDVTAAARAALGAALGRFVPGHPVSGAEAGGPRAASPDLFRDRRVVLTPLPETEAAAADLVRDAWLACGARVSAMAVAEHDAVFAAVSHLPHVLAYALVAEIAARPDAARLFGFAAGGFRDFTRIASSSPAMWRDVSVANRAAIVAEIDRYVARLALLRAAVEAGDATVLETIYAGARAARERWLAGGFDA